MKTKLRSIVPLLALCLSTTTGLRAETSRDALRIVAVDAVSEDAAKSTAAIAQLRAAGPAGLDALFVENGAAITAHKNGAAPFPADAAWTRVAAAVDAVGQQHDCYSSHLYWFTDLEGAKAAARASGKPILSLRLLGKLSDEESCANSRFFRTALYPNAQVGRCLREQFILHWASERPVPKVTVDFGDGRKLERTITGNSIHYLLDAEGRPVDALPGLYAPQPFLATLAKGRELVTRLVALSEADRAAALRTYHERGLAELEENWTTDVRAAGLATLTFPSLTSGAAENIPWEKIAAAESRPMPTAKPVIFFSPFAPPARNAMPLTTAKSGVETRLLSAITAPKFSLDSGSIALIRAQNPSAARAMPLAMSKSLTESPLLRMISEFERSLGTDTVRNEYLFHAQLHRWFIGSNGTRDLATLNRKVYADLFLTPASDPWLGLAPATTYTALTDNGKR